MPKPKPKTVVVRVTKEDIENGEHNSCDSCPVALAVHRAGMTRAEVHTTTIDPNPHLQVREIVLPEKVRNFIADFDNGQPVTPFRFTLRLP